MLRQAPPSWILLSIFLWNYFLVINFRGGRGSVAGRRGPPSAAAGRRGLDAPRGGAGGPAVSGARAAGRRGAGRRRRRGAGRRGPRRAGGAAGEGRRRRGAGLQGAPPPEGSGSGRRAAPGRPAAARGEQPRRSRLGDSVFPLLQWAAGNGLAQSAPSAALHFGLFLFGLEPPLASPPGPAPSPLGPSLDGAAASGLPAPGPEETGWSCQSGSVVLPPWPEMLCVRVPPTCERGTSPFSR